MTMKLTPVNPWSQLSLLPDEDVVIALHVTVHAREGYSTVSLTSWAEPSDELRISIAVPAVEPHRVEEVVRQLGSEFTTALRELTGPFPH